MTKEQRKRMKKEKRNHRKKNGGVKTKTSNHSKDRVPNHRFGVEPSIPLTSNELRERNEIKSHEDLGSVENICFLDWRYEGQTIWDEENGESIPHGYGKETFHKISSTQEEEISYEGGFKNGVYHGKISGFTKTHTKLGENTHLYSEKNYNDGVLNGPYKVWKDRGNCTVLKQEGHYLNGLQHGTIIIYDDGGTPQSRMNYEYGIQV